MQKYINNILIICIIFIAASCRGIYEDATEMAADYKSVVKSVSVADLKAKTEKGESYVLIDVRQSDEYMTENIPGSVSIPRGILEFKIGFEEFWTTQYMYPPEKNTEIIVYCKAGSRGVLAAISLMQLGYTNVKNLEGGYDAFNPNQDPNAKPKSSGGCGG
ncbi:MAG TPA: rhodanese-like domain-containing protein [Paludibacter sp.]|nr:rhodanese-like domain-containing protein [Paludibacter sp.]